MDGTPFGLFHSLRSEKSSKDLAERVPARSSPQDLLNPKNAKEFIAYKNLKPNHSKLLVEGA